MVAWSKTLSGGISTQDVVMEVTQPIWKSSAMPVAAARSGAVAPL